MVLHSQFEQLNPAVFPVLSDSGELNERLAEAGLQNIESVNDTVLRLLAGISEHSPHLSKLMSDHSFVLNHALSDGVEAALAELQSGFREMIFSDEAMLMKALRLYKARSTLVIALADIAGLWDLQKVTHALTQLAEDMLTCSLDYLLNYYAKHKGLRFSVEGRTGLILLAMGKLGGRELNYSSDVDLVLFYDPDYMQYEGRQSLPHCLNRLAQDFIRLMQERSEYGYGFRMDLRLRPDPSSTPLVVNVNAAMRYYEGVGQNWERAAFIKARPIGGDRETAEAFLKELQPFIWRKSLDFAAIADIQSIKRQIHGAPQDNIEVSGFDVKKGYGGIREIEFLAQIYQLIWGGRRRALRSQPTLETLQHLTEAELLTQEELETLTHNYEQWRLLEHRIQLIHDEQTHRIPEQDEKRLNLAQFCGHPTLEDFDAYVTALAMSTHQIYRESFDTSDSLSDEGTLSFTGVTHHDETLQTLHKMGYQNPEAVSDKIRQWHHGRIAAMRTVKARELLTELTPKLLRKMAEAGDADKVFIRFAKFFEALPAGVSLLSLLENNPDLLDIVLNVIANAPVMAEKLAQHPDWLDVILTLGWDIELNDLSALNSPQFYQQRSHQPEETPQWLCRYRSEHEFILGCQLLAGKIDPLESFPVLSHIADKAIQQLTQSIIIQFEERYGSFPDANFMILALGRLGSEELTFGSDLDLLFLYDVAGDATASDGEKSLSASVYFNRLSQRVVGQLTAMTPEGRLYEVDTRLRPAGDDGPLAVSLTAFQKYYAHEAWTYEKMALMRHRMIFQKRPQQGISALLQQAISLPQNEAEIRADILSMRQRIAKEYSPEKYWDMKHARGGLIDLVFAMQALALFHHKKYPQLLQNKLQSIAQSAEQCGLLTSQQCQNYEASRILQQRIQALLRLSHTRFDEKNASIGLRNILAKSLGLSHFSSVKDALLHQQKDSYKLFSEIIGEY